ncbi:MAG TPA: S41 family peptidase, partial [Balneolaceae bacterium]|nr:S41 family peptidase [Balneolaceae bacterium]
MKVFLTILFFLISSGFLSAQVNPAWIRYQAISPEGSQIAFTYNGDLFRVSTKGGVAHQLTFHEAHDTMPVWSKDGRQIAFASDRYGNFDIFLMDATSGPAKRLTFHSNDENPYSFSHDNESVIFGAVRQDLAEHRQFPAGSQPELYSVPVDGGRVDQVFTIPAEYVQVNSDGTQMIYHDKKGGENEWRKHHTSSITRDIWIYNFDEDNHEMITSFEGEDRQPVYSENEESFYYLSEESGSFNVHRMSISEPEDSEQLTSFSLHPVRFLSYANGTIVFGYDGELYTMKEGGEPEKVNVTIRTQAKSNPDKFITINGGIREMDISPDGKEIAFVARGEVFVTSVNGSMTKRITNTPEQERFVTFTPDGSGVVYSGERDGRWSIHKTVKVRDEEPFFYASTLLNEEILVQDSLDNYMASFSPNGNKMAYIAGRRTLRVRDLATGDSVDLLTPEDLFHMRDGDKYFTWSPDSRWLLVGWSKLLHNSEVLLLAADGSERINLTESGYQDRTPKWVNNGKQMIWFSNKDGLKSYATSGRSERDVYSMFFTQEEWDKYNLSEEDFRLLKEIKKSSEGDEKEDDDQEKKKEEEQEILTFDKERMKDQTARLTIHSGQISDAVLSKDGETLYYLVQFEKNYNLWETNLRTRDTKMAVRLNASSGTLSWDKEMENLYLLSGGSISKLDLSAGSSKKIEVAGEMMFDEEKERDQMFEHVYIRTKNIFYEPTFHGNDWDLLYQEYQKYLPHIGNSYEFAEMVSEMLGELNVSHAGARFSRSIENPDATASLGIFMDYEHTGNGIRIAEILEGGPLDKASFDIAPGMIIEKIDGEIVTPDRDAASFLNRKAGKFALLEITGPGNNDRKQITVKPISLGEERALLYRRFIRINEREVDQKSNGTLGYVHIPGMGDGPFRNVIQDMLGKYSDRDGVIVDTRFNGGGDLVADLAMFFTGVEFNTYATADKDVGGEPTSRWTKPTLTLINEAMYSDGHCYASAYTEL